MHAHKRPVTFRSLAALALCLLLAAAPARSTPDADAEQTIRHLIAHVSASGLTFVRNAGEHTPAQAAAHMEKKYNHFRDDIDTPEEFIDLCATRSLLSGRPYLVIDGQGRRRPTADWLRAELAAYRAHRP